MSFDFNTAETGGKSGGSSELMPIGTVARAILTITPGGDGDGGWLTKASTGIMMLSVEWVITEGRYARRRVWDYMHLSEKGQPITMRALRAVIEGHHGIMPTDMSEAAQAKRRINDFSELNGLEACILIGVKTDPKGQYPDKNRVTAVLAPGESKYIGSGGAVVIPMAGHSTGHAPAQAPSFAAPPPAASSGVKPIWAP